MVAACLAGCDSLLTESEKSTGESKELVVAQSDEEEVGNEVDRALEHDRMLKDGTFRQENPSDNSDEGLPSQEMVLYYGDGPSIQRRYTLVNNKLHGIVYDYTRDGRVTLKSMYNYGVEVGKWVYYNYEGDVSHMVEYETDTNGTRTGKIIYYNGEGSLSGVKEYDGTVLRFEMEFRDGKNYKQTKFNSDGRAIEGFSDEKHFIGDKRHFFTTGDNGLISGEACLQGLVNDGFAGIKGIDIFHRFQDEALYHLSDLGKNFQNTHSELAKIDYIRCHFSDVNANSNEAHVEINNISNIEYYSEQGFIGAE